MVCYHFVGLSFVLLWFFALFLFYLYWFKFKTVRSTIDADLTGD
jgi:hypothetical protein